MGYQFVQASACRTTTTITGIRIRMSALTYAISFYSVNPANSAKNNSIEKCPGNGSERAF